MTERHALRASYKWWLVGMLWFVCFFNYADRQAIFSVFPLLQRELHLTTVQLGIVGSSFMWTYALFGPFAGWLCDRLPRKTLVLGGLVFWSIVTASTAFARSYPQLVLCRALGGLGEAFYFPASMSLIGAYHGPETRSRAMSFHQSSVYAGTVAGGTVSGLIGQTHGWRASFLCFGGLGILLGIVLWWFLVEPKKDRLLVEIRHLGAQDNPDSLDPSYRSGFFAVLQDVLSRSIVLVLITAFMGANFVAVVFLTWMPTFLFTKFHMSLAMAGLSGTAYLQLASVAGVLAGGALADFAIKRGIGWNRSGRLVTQAFGLICGVPFLFLTGWTQSKSILLGALIGFGLFKGLYDANIWASLYDVVPLRQRGSAVGIMNSLGWLGGGSAPLLVAVAADRYGMSIALSTTAIIYLAVGLGLLFAARLLYPKQTS